MDNIVFLRIFQHKIDLFKDNHFTTFNLNSQDINDIFSRFVQIADDDKVCFNVLNPWNDISNIQRNDCVIIAYNLKNFVIQGWCNIVYNSFDTSKDKTNVSYLYIDKVVTRTVPKINGLGTHLINFIKNYCMNNVDIMYLFSLPLSQGFYDKFDFFNIHKTDDVLTYYYINPSSKVMNNDSLEDIKIFWDFENNAAMQDDVIETYKNNILDIPKLYGDKCNMSKNILDFHNKDFKNKLYNHTISIKTLKRKYKSPLESYNTRSVMSLRTSNKTIKTRR